MHGGSRPGSGRKKGDRKADLAKALERKRSIDSVEKILGDGLTPLKYLIQVMRESKRPVEIRIDAAKAAAPYVHRRQPQDVQVTAQVEIEGVEIEILGLK